MRMIRAAPEGNDTSEIQTGAKKLGGCSRVALLVVLTNWSE